jgi:hypothetical protein
MRSKSSLSAERRAHGEIISNCETGNPPEGWESEGQFRIAHFVIPAKFRKAGREPGSRNNLVVLNFYWIPDLARLAWIFHALLSRDLEDGRATWQPQGVGSEAYLKRYAAGAGTRGRKEGRPYPWSQQVIHEISRLGRRTRPV